MATLSQVNAWLVVPEILDLAAITYRRFLADLDLAGR
jgi:hypothetical protein